MFLFVFTEEQSNFEAVYEKYKRLMLKKAVEILRDHALAEDAVSEAMLRVYKNMHKISELSSPQTAAFVVTVVKNVALTMLSRQKSESEIQDYIPSNENIEAEILDNIAAEEIMAVVDGIGEEYKSVFILKYAYGMNHREIARTLGLTENNVTVRLHRARSKISKELKERGIACVE